MAKFTSKPIEVATPAQAVADKFADLSRLQPMIDAMPAEERAKVGSVSLTPDSIIMSTPQVGDITLKVTERTPSRVAFTAVGAPVPMSLGVDIEARDADSCTVKATMEVNIPDFLKPMIGGTMQKAVDQFGQLIAKLA